MEAAAQTEDLLFELLLFLRVFAGKDVVVVICCLSAEVVLIELAENKKTLPSM